MRLTVTNRINSPYGLHTTEGPRMLNPGEKIEADFTDAEARNIAGNPAVFLVEGYTEIQSASSAPPSSGQREDAEFAHPDLVGPIAARLNIADAAAFTDTVIKALDEGDKARQTLADIAALFGDGVNPEEVEDKVADLIDQVAAFDGDGDGKTGGSTGNEKLSLADAVASLDDANDAHWIQSGKPALEVLSDLTGSNVLRADADAIGRMRKVS